MTRGEMAATTIVLALMLQEDFIIAKECKLFLLQHAHREAQSSQKMMDPVILHQKHVNAPN